MSIAEQLRQKSKLVKSQKAKRALEKTIAEKRKKAKALAEKMAKEKAILQKQREKLSAEKLKRSIELENLKFLERTFSRYMLEAWNGKVQINPTDIEIKGCGLLSQYGLKVLSTEDFVNQLNKNLSEINKLIQNFNHEYLIFMSQFKKKSKSILLCTARDIQNESYDFLKENNNLFKTIDLCKQELRQKIDSLNAAHSRLVSNSERTKKNIGSLVNHLSDLAERYSDCANEFESEYLNELHSPSPEILYENPELMKLTYTERLADRRYQFRVAKRVMIGMGLTIPKQEELLNYENSSFNSHSPLDADSEFDILGRYLAFFRIVDGGNPYDAVINSVKEEFVINIFPDGAEYRQQLMKIEWQIREEGNALKKFIKFDAKDYLSKIDKKIRTLKNKIDDGRLKIPFDAVSFKAEELFDLDNLKKYQGGSDAVNQYIQEIQWIISPTGRTNIDKFINALERSSSMGRFSLELAYIDNNGFLTFSLNKRRIFELSVSMQSFLKILSKDKFAYALKSSKTSNVLIIKW